MTAKAPTNPNIPPPLGITGQVGVYLVQMAKDVTWFLYQITQRANATLPEDGSERMTGPLPFAQYATASLPAAASYPDSIVWDTTAGVFKYSDGVSWLILGSGAGSVTSVVGDETYITTSPDPIVSTGTVSPTGLSSAVLAMGDHRMYGGI